MSPVPEHANTVAVPRNFLLNLAEMLDLQKRTRGDLWSSWNQEQLDKLREFMTDEEIAK